MEILQLPMLALQERIEAEMQSNPVLELHDPDVDEQAPPVKEDQPADRGERDMVVDGKNGHTEDFQRLSEFEDEYDMEPPHAEAAPRAPQATGERDRKLDAMANTPAPEQSLDEYLLQQWSFVEAEEPIKAAGRLIINFIDDDGYLRTPLEELPKHTNEPVTQENLAAALKIVQTLEPPGVGARDLKECLLIQLAAESAAGRDVTLEIEFVSAVPAGHRDEPPAADRQTHRQERRAGQEGYRKPLAPQSSPWLAGRPARRTDNRARRNGGYRTGWGSPRGDG